VLRSILIRHRHTLLHGVLSYASHHTLSVPFPPLLYFPSHLGSSFRTCYRTALHLTFDLLVLGCNQEEEQHFIVPGKLHSNFITTLWSLSRLPTTIHHEELLRAGPRFSLHSRLRLFPSRLQPSILSNSLLFLRLSRLGHRSWHQYPSTCRRWRSCRCNLSLRSSVNRSNWKAHHFHRSSTIHFHSRLPRRSLSSDNSYRIGSCVWRFDYGDQGGLWCV